MEPFTRLTATAAPFLADDVDTDQIFPARFSSKDRNDGQFATYLFHDLRFDESGQRRPDFVLNDDRLAGTQIIVAAENYACGSARPGAIFSHLDYGIRVIIAESFGPVFAEIAYKSGLLTIRLPRQQLATLRQQLVDRPGSAVTLDLERQIITAPDGTTFPFEIDGFARKMLLSGKSEIDLTLSSRDKIEAYEGRHRSEMPWIFNKTLQTTA